MIDDTTHGKYRVMASTCEKVLGANYYKELLVQFLTMVVRDSFLILQLVNIDTILGLKWMQDKK